MGQSCTKPKAVDHKRITRDDHKEQTNDGVSRCSSTVGDLPPARGHTQKRRTQDRAPKPADVLFLIDATASMAGYIKAVKDQAKRIANELQQDDGIHARMGLVAYRDFDIEAGTEKFDFSHDIHAFEKFLDGVQATSDTYPGGQVDLPEDVFSGIEAARDMDWSGVGVRVIIHIGDAPQHGEQFHDLKPSDDNFIHGDPKGRDLKSMFDYLRKEKEVHKYVFFHLCQDTKKMLAKFKEVSRTPKFFDEHEFNQRGFHWETDFAQFIKKHVTYVVRSNATMVLRG